MISLSAQLYERLDKQVDDNKLVQDKLSKELESKTKAIVAKDITLLKETYSENDISVVQALAFHPNKDRTQTEPKPETSNKGSRKIGVRWNNGPYFASSKGQILQVPIKS
jgi:hypothetical protein